MEERSEFEDPLVRFRVHDPLAFVDDVLLVREGLQAWKGQSRPGSSRRERGETDCGGGAPELPERRREVAVAFDSAFPDGLDFPCKRTATADRARSAKDPFGREDEARTTKDEGTHEVGAENSSLVS